jgi:hypothetical protein
MDRRSFLWGSARVAAATIATAPVSAAIPAPIVPSGPLTPAEYLREMQAIGWRPVASVLRGKPQHVIEYGPTDSRRGTIENQIAFLNVQNRRPDHSLEPDFWKHTSQYLYDLGLREDVGPVAV